MIRNNVVTSEPDKGLLLNNYSCESDDNVFYRKKLAVSYLALGHMLMITMHHCPVICYNDAMLQSRRIMKVAQISQQPL